MHAGANMPVHVRRPIRAVVDPELKSGYGPHPVWLGLYTLAPFNEEINVRHILNCPSPH